MPSKTSFSSIPRPAKAKTFLSQFLGTGAVAEANVADGSITVTKLADNSVELSKLKLTGALAGERGLTFSNTEAAGNAHLGLKLSKGLTAAAAYIEFQDAGTPKWDMGIIEENAFSIRDKANLRKVLVLVEGAPTNSLVVGSEGALGILDGIGAPATVAGRAHIYVDVADGDLKVKFGDGTVKTIVVDT